MPDHPIEALMKTTMDSIKEMVDVNTILGDPVETPDGTVILPVSRVTFGFAAGGSEFQAAGGGALGHAKGATENGEEALPFGGGAGAGITVQPVAFLVVGQGQIRALPVDGGAIIDRLIDVVPSLLGQMSARRRQSPPASEVSAQRPNVQGGVQ
ncbi:MAG: GerW family sporulation protein [Firmicutes bacterium]|jgi:sporulation protein YtfJ|nr:GerW family sporulation protein [Bacillota bacterium]MDH7495548.1 GerW family sporulation protein [Bacillota bacterium]